MDSLRQTVLNYSDKPLWSVAKACKFLGFGRDKVFKIFGSKIRREGARYLISVEDIIQYLRG